MNSKAATESSIQETVQSVSQDKKYEYYANRIFEYFTNPSVLGLVLKI